jgi:HPt (histidine-containing phosphotransfer) domain-containing protein
MTDTPIFSNLANDPDFHDLVSAFVIDLPIRSGTIIQAIRGGSFEDAAELLHQLKGASGIYGFHPIHLLAKEVESLIRSGDPNLEEKATELDRLCHRASAKPN